MILLIQNSDIYEPDLRAILKAFFPEKEITVVAAKDASHLPPEKMRGLIFTALYFEEGTRFRIEEGGRVLFTAYTGGNALSNRKKYRNRIKLASYRILTEYTRRLLPWGCLTGMRPTKIATEAFLKGYVPEEVIAVYQENYDTSREKATLATAVARKEMEILSAADPVRDYALYIGIPFCPTRCLYCSFAAYPIYEMAGKVKPYLLALKEELKAIAEMNRGRRLATLYIGGGTPTSLSANELNRLLTDIEEIFDTNLLPEYTVEAGRPDSLNREKLTVLKAHGVGRICINPQSMNEKTLQIIGRAHTPAVVRQAFDETRLAGFKNINMDIIVGLPGENIEDVRYTLREIEKLRPESLTVHSLAVKRASRLNIQMDKYRELLPADVEEMRRLAGVSAGQMNMQPYYLYRQKQIAGNLENVGYARLGKECHYNVLIMEEAIDIFAAGAGGVTRLLNREEGVTTRVDRVANVKDVDGYITRIDEMIDRKYEGIEDRSLG